MARAKSKKKLAPKAKKAKPVKPKLAKKSAKSAKKTAKRAATARPAPQKAASKLLKLVPKPAAKTGTKSVSKASKSSALQVGSQAPDFTLPITGGGTVNLSSLKGKPYILYFYPKDDTSGCTAQACEFRNNLSIFNEAGVAVIGVSKDSLDSHDRFTRKYSLTFPLASDESAGVSEKFGTWVQKSMYGRSYMGIERTTFLVDGNGVIRNIWRKVSVSGHIDEVKKAVRAL